MVEDDVATAAVGDGIVGVVRVVPILQRRKVEVHAVDYGIGGVIAIARELDEVAEVDERHGRLYSDVAIIGREQSQANMKRSFGGDRKWRTMQGFHRSFLDAGQLADHPRSSVVGPASISVCLH